MSVIALQMGCDLVLEDCGHILTCQGCGTCDAHRKEGAKSGGGSWWGGGKEHGDDDAKPAGGSSNWWGGGGKAENV